MPQCSFVRSDSTQCGERVVAAPPALFCKIHAASTSCKLGYPLTVSRRELLVAGAGKLAYDPSKGKAKGYYRRHDAPEFAIEVAPRLTKGYRQYRTSVCVEYVARGSCPWGSTCVFAHEEYSLRIASQPYPDFIAEKLWNAPLDYLWIAHIDRIDAVCRALGTSLLTERDMLENSRVEPGLHLISPTRYPPPKGAAGASATNSPHRTPAISSPIIGSPPPRNAWGGKSPVWSATQAPRTALRSTSSPGFAPLPPPALGRSVSAPVDMSKFSDVLPGLTSKYSNPEAVSDAHRRDSSRCAFVSRPNDGYVLW